MPRFLLVHRHEPDECRWAVAAWHGHDSPLRGTTALCSCVHGGHEVVWDVEAADEHAALALVPPFVAARARVVPVRPFPTP